ncbi:MAG: glycosyltransferase, partial [Gammaproteobacteria bacterium]|nr:glycosyltransferase [Gammaproteobacteria bacterium]
AATHAAVAAGADAVLALWALPCGWWARRSARAHGVPYGVWCLGSDIWVYGRKRLTRPLVRSVLSGAALRWADGLALAREVESLAGASCAFLPSSRRLPALAPALRDSPPYRLTFIGRWHPNKGTDLLMEALGLLNDHDWQRIGQVQIHGGGPLEEVVRADAARLVAAGRPVQVFGFIGKDEAARVLAVTDWLLIPSRIESIPVVFSDALAAGTPVIATPVGDLPELLGEHAVGVCASAATAAGMAAAIREAVNGVPGAHAGALATLARDFDIRRSAADVLRDLPGR